MVDRDFLDALDDCIDRLNQGQSIEDCTRRYPQHAAELGPRLETRVLVRRAQPNPLEVTQARDRVRFRLENHRRQRRSSLTLGRVAGGVFTMLIVALISVSVLAENSLPGDSLYAVKRLTENVRVAFASSPIEAHQELEARRIAEIRRVLALKRAADVEFEGDVQAMNGSDWRVSDLALRVTPDVPGAPTVHIGDTIAVQADTTTQGTLIARALTVLQSPPPTVTPSPTPSDTPTMSIPGTLTPTTTNVPPMLGVTLPASSTPTLAVPGRPASAVTATPHPTSGTKGSNSSGSNSGNSGSNSSGSNSGSSGGSGSSPGGSGSGSGGSGSNSGSSGGSGSNSSGSNSGSSGGSSSGDSGGSH